MPHKHEYELNQICIIFKGLDSKERKALCSVQQVSLMKGLERSYHQLLKEYKSKQKEEKEGKMINADRNPVPPSLRQGLESKQQNSTQNRNTTEDKENPKERNTKKKPSFFSEIKFSNKTHQNIAQIILGYYLTLYEHNEPDEFKVLDAPAAGQIRDAIYQLMVADRNNAALSQHESRFALIWALTASACVFGISGLLIGAGFSFDIFGNLLCKVGIPLNLFSLASCRYDKSGGTRQLILRNYPLADPFMDNPLDTKPTDLHSLSRRSNNQLDFVSYPLWQLIFAPFATDLQHRDNKNHEKQSTDSLVEPSTSQPADQKLGASTLQPFAVLQIPDDEYPRRGCCYAFMRFFSRFTSSRTTQADSGLQASLLTSDNNSGKVELVINSIYPSHLKMRF